MPSCSWICEISSLANSANRTRISLFPVKRLACVVLHEARNVILDRCHFWQRNDRSKGSGASRQRMGEPTQRRQAIRFRYPIAAHQGRLRALPLVMRSCNSYLVIHENTPLSLSGLPPDPPACQVAQRARVPPLCHISLCQRSILLARSFCPTDWS